MTDNNEMELLRVEIDKLDDQIVEVLNDRAKLVLKIREVKMKEGLPRHDPEREAEVKRRVISENKGPLPDDAIRRIYEHILYHMRLFPNGDRVEDIASDH